MLKNNNSFSSLIYPIITKTLLYKILLKQNISQHRFYQNGTCFRSFKPSSGVKGVQIYRKMQLNKVAISVFVGQHKFTKRTERAALKILKDNVNLTILPADKGNATVILNTSDYKQKISSLLQDPAYRKLTKDPTDSIERKTTALLKKSSITEETRRQLCPAGSRPPILYGLPKVHKEGIPLRPIVSNIGAPKYQLSKHLSGLLNQHTGKTAHHVKTHSTSSGYWNH